MPYEDLVRIDFQSMQQKVSKQNALQLFATNAEIDCKNLLTKPYKKAYDEVIRETGEGI